MPKDANKDIKRTEIMQKCFDRYCETGFKNTSIKDAAEACGMSAGNLYLYFNNLDDLIVQSTEFCMSKVEDEFMAMAPKSIADVERFLDEAPEWTKQKHGAKYRLMYQVYTIPKYLEYGHRFFEGVNERYKEYAKKLELSMGIPWQTLESLILIFVRAAVHYALFGDKEYLDLQISFLRKIAFHYVEEASKKELTKIDK